MKSNDLEPGFSRVDSGGVGLGVGNLAAARPQANAPGERRPVPLPGVRDPVHRVVRQVNQRARLPALLQPKSKAQGTIKIKLLKNRRAVYVIVM